MNAPERYEMFTLPEGVRKISIVKDPKMANCLQFNIQREDHTIANILRYQLLKHPLVLFAAYRSPHPLEYYVELKVQTTAKTTPIEVMRESIQSLMIEYGNIRSAFDTEIYRLDAPTGEDTRRTARTGTGYGGFGSMDTQANDFGSSGDMGGRGGRTDDVDIDF
ncbi:DNA-directed RNA polymerase II core subunit [Coemansia aciculifera]|uniref:DNA-directed RNA polymerase II core subunit n=2 Tax=Coemansia TaxID=4863 RepID=A0A9W8H5W1_9FUNG|nr:DNA-directed RNA polymerase II core subunit [Coemansia pectinata]KAJ2860547.1 DNA-directed RNA polymerase II core subunit [Coemansia aciculifera]KAJ2870532.1 DNA-directed RNA polymerase II core subunit [Coemansia aciculifera]KAJ2881659.1 DNA-directed RNA polymerase II core subunit [Coemansia aciculifera]